MNPSTSDAATLSENRRRAANVKAYLPIIHRRWTTIFRLAGMRWRSKKNVEMDIYYTLKNFPGSDAKDLAEAPDDIFVHDMMGITNHLCRDPGPDEGKMLHCFLPKFVCIGRRAAAKPEATR